MSTRRRLMLFTRFPAPGQSKTRLIPALGAAGAAGLQRRLTVRAFRAARVVAEENDIEIELRFDGGDESVMRNWLGDGPIYREQGEGDLGKRMARALEDSFLEGSSGTIVIGADCPQLTPELLSQAFAQLSTHSVVLGPATDGGYYLLGLKQPLPELFKDITWGGSTVLAESLKVLRRANLVPCLLPPLSDIDRPEDLPLWRHIVETEEADLRLISVILPALNEAANITQTVTRAAAGQPSEILVVDGGSCDDTVQMARKAGATILHSGPGRSRQMNCGAANAIGNVVLFLHADTWLPLGYGGCVAELLGRPRLAAGAFSFSVRDQFPGKRLLEGTTNLRSRWLQIPYGDQGLFVRRALFEELGGFAPLPLMEDYEMVRRLRRCGWVLTVPLAASTSGRRWQRLGLVRTTLVNQLMLLGFHLGLPLEKMAAFYKKDLRG